MHRSIAFFLCLTALPVAFLIGPAAAEGGEEQWKLIYEKDGVKAYRNFARDESKYAEFMGEGLIDAPFHKVLAVYDGTDRATEWVSDCTEASEVEIKTPSHKIAYNVTDLPWPVTDRDFVYEEVWSYNPTEKKVHVVIRSVDHPSKPPPAKGDKLVRGVLLYSEFNAWYVDEDTTKVMVRIHADPKGTLPAAIVNMVSRSWPFESVTNLRRQSMTASGYESRTEAMRSKYPLAP